VNVTPAMILFQLGNNIFFGTFPLFALAQGIFFEKIIWINLLVAINQAYELPNEYP